MIPTKASPLQIDAAPSQSVAPLARTLLWFIAVLLLVDLVFIGVHLSHVYGPGPASKQWWDLGQDLSVAEIWQYLKLGGTAVALLALWRRHHQLVLLAWSGIFAFLTLDDSLQGHEKVGGRIARFFDIPDWENSPVGSVRGQDFGELAAAGIFVVPMLIALFIGLRQSGGSSRIFSWRMFVLSALLATAGVAVDFVVHAMDAEWIFLIEDGTEMVAVSLIAWLVARVWTSRSLSTGLALPFSLMGLGSTADDRDITL